MNLRSLKQFHYFSTVDTVYKTYDSHNAFLLLKPFIKDLWNLLHVVPVLCSDESSNLSQPPLLQSCNTKLQQATAKRTIFPFA